MRRLAAALLPMAAIASGEGPMKTRPARLQALGEIGGETFHKEPNLLEQIAYRDTWGKGADSFISIVAKVVAYKARIS